MDLDIGTEDTSEEAQSLDVIRVQVCEEHVDALDAVDELVTEAANTGTGIEHDDIALTVADLDTGGVAAIADGLRTWRRLRTPGAPQVHLHAGTSQNSAAHRADPMRARRAGSP